MTNSMLFSNDALQGQTALVTGASRGIGREIASLMAAAGATVIGTATSETGAAAIAERLGDAGTGKVLDVSNAASIDALLSDIKSSPPTILVNNAGITRDNLLMRMKDAEWDDVIATNLSGVFRLTKGCVRGMMKARHGRIISVSSVVGTMGNAGQANYAAAKAGLVGFTKSIARELGSRGITANVIAPGFIATDMTDQLTDDQREAMLSQVPLGSLGNVSDIAQSAVFLASAGGRYISGETLHVNGGMWMV